MVANGAEVCAQCMIFPSVDLRGCCCSVSAERSLVAARRWYVPLAWADAGAIGGFSAERAEMGQKGQ